MQDTNPLIIPEGEQFVVGVSDFSDFDLPGRHIESGAILFCRKGTAEVSIDERTGHIARNTLMLLIGERTLSFSQRTDDFRLMFVCFSRELVADVGFRLDMNFFRMLHENPIIRPRLASAIGEINTWFRSMAYLYRDRANIFRQTIVRNRLQNVLLETCDKLYRRTDMPGQTAAAFSSRQSELFFRFVELVHECCMREREVSFYAEKLYISPRYLSTIVRNVAHVSTKELIDHTVLLEIKKALTTTEMPVQEIADRMHFADQSYLGRYFKKLTGQSPAAFRNKRND